jgi:hypothetical protein
MGQGSRIPKLPMGLCNSPDVFKRRWMNFFGHGRSPCLHRRFTISRLAYEEEHLALTKCFYDSGADKGKPKSQSSVPES